MVTCLGLLLTIVAGWLFFKGAIAVGLIAAWAMTFLDTVDGKLARVTVTSSRLGNGLITEQTSFIHRSGGRAWRMAWLSIFPARQN